MTKGDYSIDRGGSRHFSRKRMLIGSLVVVLILGLSFGLKSIPKTVRKISNSVNGPSYDQSVTATEKGQIKSAINKISLAGDPQVSVTTSLEVASNARLLEAYVPVTNKYSAKQQVQTSELNMLSIYVPNGTDPIIANSIAKTLGLDSSKITSLPSSIDKIYDSQIAFIPVGKLTPDVKLLSFNNAYYLDSFKSGAIFRQAQFRGGGSASYDNLTLSDLPNKDSTFKVNMTGVTALTRVMQKKLNIVKDPKYFSKNIGSYLADADITHVSNEVSFKTGCTYSDTVFCAPPEMIETLKDSGVDLVELTGNHNNDSGDIYNTETINKYHSLGWKTIGGGLNKTEAAKYYVADIKKSKVAFLGYNYADSPGGIPIATGTTAGANSFDYDKIKADIISAKKQSNFVIIDVQFWECYAYPEGFVEFPECDLPITDQKAVFRKLIDLGADMVIGTQAHQPQVYETYKDKPIYYGLGNLYFEQTQWPGTERGIILSHYFVAGKLLQTKLAPTSYDRNLQTTLMGNQAAEKFLDRLKNSRSTAGL